VITVSHATKTFGAFHALDDVTLDIPAGSLTALLGPSGSGKSTLLRAVAGLETLDTGSVVIDGVDVTHAVPQKRGIGMVFQHYAAFKHLTVHDNVGFGLAVRKRPRAQIAARVGELLELVGLAGLAGRYPDQLSGGQRQRMALARALAIEPSVLLLDEPFGALDATVRADLRAWLRRLHDEVHVTTVLVTHDQEEALEVADRIAVLNKGRLEQVDEPLAVYDHPANAFVMGFVGSVARVGDALVRPHRIALRRPDDPASAPSGTPDGHVSVDATVDRIARLGAETIVELLDASGRRFAARLSRADSERLGLSRGERVAASAPRDPHTADFADDYVI